MATERDVYRELQKNLDNMPVGFPATESDVEIRLLKHLFTPEEAEIASYLSALPEPLSAFPSVLKKVLIEVDNIIYFRYYYRHGILLSFWFIVFVIKQLYEYPFFLSLKP